MLLTSVMLSAALAQTPAPPRTPAPLDSTEAAIRKVADHIVAGTSFQYVNTKTGVKVGSTAGLAPSPDVKAESRYNKWVYPDGVLAVGMVEAASILKDATYSDYARKNYRFIFDNIDYFRKGYEAGEKKVEFGPFFRMSALDDCGSMAAGLLDVYAFDQRVDYMAYLKRAADYIMNRQLKLPDSTLCRDHPRALTIWADDLYMSVPFLARMGKLTGDPRYVDFAIHQVEQFNHYLFDPATGLYFHCYYSDMGVNGVVHWGRANGWLAMAQAMLIDHLPKNHPKKAELIGFLLRQVIGFSRYQDNATGLWHQVLDKPDAYLETSVSAMFAYTVAKAVNEGWIHPRYLSIARDAWGGLLSRITPGGELQDVCIGTNIEDDIRFYYNRPKETDDLHGLGPLLLAGSEILRAERAPKPAARTGAPALGYGTSVAAQLPAPYTTASVHHNSKVVGWPEGMMPRAPEGFTVTKYADHLRNPRWFYVLPNGDVLVSESATNKKRSADDILLLRDTNHDGIPDVREVFMSGLHQPLGMLLLNGWFYVGNTDGVYRYPYKDGQLHIAGDGQKILDLPAGGYNNHWTRNLIASPDGSKIYVSVGSGSNNAEHGMEHENRRADILVINPDGSGERVFASGIRNPVGMDWAPGTQTLWTAVNERDSLGDDLVPDYFTHVEDGGFYGWPYAYFGPHEDPRLAGQRPDLVARTLVPDVSLGAHTASLGLAFYTAKAFPSKYRGGAFIGQHGSWNRSVFSGYRVVFVPFTGGKPGIPEDFLTGFIKDEATSEAYGRPVGVAVLPDGSLLVADDEGNTLWRVVYGG
ncbi:glucose/arabinose dehydrogenase [Dinghuibacter silviterrae]|uniref:Glucose/arabinose dehydrogenase n=2 Tax=Dinghuibacter silviterrae TaxID=1539049 RepID=A0A4R8DS78_9BACT|nr:glucose/arabinose dehydrogenase [Dinghuibacter silviterrae]